MAAVIAKIGITVARGDDRPPPVETRLITAVVVLQEMVLLGAGTGALVPLLLARTLTLEALEQLMWSEWND